MNKNVETLKRAMRDSMIKNFENDGSLIPVLFYLENDKPNFSAIPSEYLSSFEGKSMLGAVIQNKCVSNNVTAIGMVFEAYGLSANLDIEKDKNLIDKILNGEMKVSETNEKKDIIVLIFSTPEKHEVISYCVDVENKKVLDKFDGVGGESVGGMFNEFFKWTKK